MYVYNKINNIFERNKHSVFYAWYVSSWRGKELVGFVPSLSKKFLSHTRTFIPMKWHWKCTVFISTVPTRNSCTSSDYQFNMEKGFARFSQLCRQVNILCNLTIDMSMAIHNAKLRVV